ncbi:CoA pyrophosphatase [Ferroglobus sp.]|uniref:NUDIX hydrolase n=1 Tax=Ferroglobus sp. TaxID=2614230 RepID=UPI0025C428FB|nr:CoA pyrophosphatase [Ferroglobus sp.]
MVKRLKDILDPELKYVKNERVAAVLVPITFDLELVMIKRAKNLSRSAGHIAFPGGIRERTESIVETALREAEEEIGVKRENINVLGYLSPKEVVEHRIKIHPVVGIVSSKNFTPDNYEVEKILVDDLKRVLKSRRIADWGPNFECAGELVWGASSRILDDFYLRIVKKFGNIDDFFSPESSSQH